MTASSSEAEAKQRAATAVATVLAPICVENFQHDAGADKNLGELMQVRSWERAAFLEKGGWATLPGNDKPVLGVAKACAEILTSQS